MKIFLSIGILFFLSDIAGAKIIYVPADELTIQAGINTAIDGDTVLVADGTYTGEGNLYLSFGGKAIVVKSANGSENCIIDCVTGTNVNAFKLGGGESKNSVIDGFTIKNGFYVIYLLNSSPTIKNNVLINNIGGVYCGSFSRPVIENNIMSDNYHNGILCYKSAPTIRNNKIQNNGWSGIRVLESQPQIINNLISENSNLWGGGIKLIESAAAIIGNIISNNLAEYYGGGIYAEEDTSKIVNNTIVYNSAAIGGAIYSRKSDQTIINNIVAFSNHFIPPNQTIIIRPNESYTSAVYHYSSGLLNGIYCSERFMNIGDAGNIKVSVPGAADTSIYLKSNEKYSLFMYLNLRESGIYSTVYVNVYFDNDTLEMPIGLGAEYISTEYRVLNSIGVIPTGGIIAIEEDTSKVSYCDFNSNEDGNYFTSEDKQDLLDITNLNRSFIADPMFNDSSFVLSSNSPCIDNGLPDTSGLNLPDFDINGVQRILDGDQNESCVVDIGACEYEHNTGIFQQAVHAKGFRLFQNYPNPFNPITTIIYRLPKGDNVVLKIFNLNGEEVATLINSKQSAGEHRVTFNAYNLSSGLYFYQLKTTDFINTRKFILQK